LTEVEHDLGFVRLYDLPIEAEAHERFWSWPYMHCGDDGGQPYRCNGQPCPTVKLGRYVPGILGSGSEVLGSLPNEGVWAAWEDLVKLSREAIGAETAGEFKMLIGLLPEVKPFATMMVTEKLPGTQANHG